MRLWLSRAQSHERWHVEAYYSNCPIGSALSTELASVLFVYRNSDTILFSHISPIDTNTALFPQPPPPKHSNHIEFVKTLYSLLFAEHHV